MAIHWDCVQRIVQGFEFLLRQTDVPGAEVFQNPSLVFGSRDRHHVRILVQHPGQGYLGIGRVFHFGILRNQINDRTVGFNVFAAQLGDKFAHVILMGEIVPSLHLAGQEPAGNGGKGHQADIVLQAVRDHCILHTAFHHGIDILDG